MTIRDRKVKNINFNQSRTFGVELELTGYDTSKASDWLHSNGYEAYTSDLQILADFLSYKTGLRVNGGRGYRSTNPSQNESNTSTWDLKTDGSVGGMGLELVSHILKGNDGLSELKEICSALNYVDATVNRSSGLHVHHSRKNFPLSAEAQLMMLYNANAVAISSVITPSRVNSGYGGFNNPRDLATASDYANNRQHENALDPRGNNTNLHNSGRVAVNLNPRYTIEFRQHSGSTDYNKIANWIFLTQAFMNEAKRRVTSKSADRKNLASVSASVRMIVDCKIVQWSSASDNPNATKVFNAFVKQSVRTMMKSLKLRYVTKSLYPTDDHMNGLGTYLLNRSKELTIGRKDRTMSANTSAFASALYGVNGSYTLVGQTQFNKNQVAKATVKANDIIHTVSAPYWDGKVTKLYQ